MLPKAPEPEASTDLVTFGITGTLCRYCAKSCTEVGQSCPAETEAATFPENAAVSQVHSIHIEHCHIRGNCTEPGGEGAQVAITTDAHDITLRGNTIARGGDGAAGVGVRCGPETHRIELLENDFADSTELLDTAARAGLWF